MSIPRMTAVVAAGLLALPGCAQLTGSSATNSSASTDEAAIRDAGAARDTAFRALDASAMTGFYAGDAVLMPEAAKVARGSAEVRKFLDVYMKLLTEGGYTPVVDPAVEIDVAGSLALRSGTYTIVDKAGATADAGKWLEAWRKGDDGQWRIVRDIRNSDMLTLFAPMAYTEDGAKDE